MRLTKNLLLLFVILFTTSCASIVSDSSYPITISTDPPNANVSIKNRSGIEIYKGKSPATISLKSGDGFFRKAFYTVTVTKDGYDKRTMPIDFGIDGWYFGNLLFGGVIGMLIIDPATGAMYRLRDEYMVITLDEASMGDASKPELKIYDLAHLPPEYQDKIVLIEP